MFVDEARIYVKAGSGGDGCNSMHRDIINRKGRPDGGPGGDGGDVVIEVSNNVQTLLDFQYRQHHEAHSGTHGGSSHKKGRRGQDLRIKVPAGTTIKDFDTGLVLRDLVKTGDEVVIARGGRGGRGNSKFRHSEEGSPGEEKTILLELRLIADAGIVGHPNAGKSTLISKISSAHPKIASYPFTTKEPVLGVVKAHEDAVFVVAEIPGLIKGAHEGRGLGDRFLRHIERTKVLIHLIDIAAYEGRDPVADYKSLNHELVSYSKELAARPQIVALNKIELTSAKDHIKKFKKALPGIKVFPISAMTGEGLDKLIKAVYRKVKKVKDAKA